ncbi:hypothetical protein KCU67_g84, partial [Aureobasidium melanogenum]
MDALASRRLFADLLVRSLANSALVHSRSLVGKRGPSLLHSTICRAHQPWWRAPNDIRVVRLHKTNISAEQARDRISELVFRFSIFFAAEKLTNGQTHSSLLVYKRLHFQTLRTGLHTTIAVLRGCTSTQGIREHHHWSEASKCSSGTAGWNPDVIHARSDPPAFMLRWSEDYQILHYGDDSLSMKQLGSFASKIVSSSTMLCARLMYDWQPEFDLRRSKTTSATFKKASRLLIIVSPSNGLLVDNNCHVPHILSLECGNGPSTERGIYAHEGSMVYVTRHHKALKVTNREFHVLRYLPQQVGRILFLHLVYIREVTTLLLYAETTRWQRDNEHLRSGSSLTYVNNQTINIVSHIVGAMISFLLPMNLYQREFKTTINARMADLVVIPL